MAYEKLPKNANGKIDRPRLREAFRNNGQALASTQTGA
jgi:acyl-coenzyme A synthetase/AMP-(fatty) acid ligase